MRLTEKGLEADEIGMYANSPEFYDIYKKLSKLEDLEERLGVDLPTLFKAMEEGFYVKNRGGDVAEERATAAVLTVKFPYGEKPHFVLEGDRSMYTSMYGFVRVGPEDYGKTWALTKEELQ